jgi:hypothetical protein
MDEVTAGLLGAAVTVGAAQVTPAPNFTGHYGNSHREVMMEGRRNADELFADLPGAEVTPEEEPEIFRTRAECVPRVKNAKTDPACDRAIQRENEYHESIESYKTVSWFNIPQKFKRRKDVRRGKRLTRETNQTLRNLNEVRCFSRAKPIPDECEVYELRLRHFVILCVSTWIQSSCRENPGLDTRYITYLELCATANEHCSRVPRVHRDLHL